MTATELPQVTRKHPAAKCEECPMYEKGKYVPPERNGTKMVMVGEAPGATEAKRGRPFIGMSGKLLDEVMKEVGLSRKNATLTNTIMCRPAGNANPSAKAVECCKPALWSEIAEADPEYVVALGKFAASAIMGKDVKILNERVGPPKHIKGKSWKFVPTVHPAATLRNTNLFPALAADMKKLTPSYLQVVWEPPKYKEFSNATQARAAIHQLLERERADTLVLDLEVGEDKDDSFGHPNTLLAAGVGYEPGKVAVLGREAFKSNQVRQDFANLLTSKKVVCHNTKYDLGVLHRMGIGTFRAGADTMLMSYTQDEVPGTHGLKYLAKEHLGAPDWDKELDQWKKWSDIPPDVLNRYNAYDVACTWDLMEKFQKEMDSNDRRLHEYLCWASDGLMLIESEGIYIDREALDNLDEKLQAELKAVGSSLEEMYTAIGEGIDSYTQELVRRGGGFNPNSPKQVKGAFEAMTGSTLTTTDAEMLEILTNHKKKSVRELATKMLTWRKVGKMYGTYVKGTQIRLDDDGRIRTSYLLHGTETGRTSSRNPNVQNAPRQGGFRQVYAAEPGNKGIYGDYSNIEGRVVTVLSNSESMREYMVTGEKIHNVVAKAFYGNNFDKEQYTLAKSVVHGVNYARTPEGIAQGLGVSLSEATKVYNQYHRLFPEIKPWHNEVKRQVLETDEPLMTPWGRKRRFGLITRDNMEDVYKEALAFQPQSIASDICLTAAIRLKNLGYSVRIFIHDGIFVECKEDEVEQTKEAMNEIMVQSGREYTDKVPFPVDFQVGDSWGDAEDAS